MGRPGEPDTTPPKPDRGNRDARRTQPENDEGALRASEAKYRSLFETMGQGYAELEVVRDETGLAVDQLVLELNPAFERLFGMQRSDARGRRVSEILPGLDAHWTETFDRVARSRTPERIEQRLASSDRWFEAFAYPGETTDRLVVLYEEISDRKRRELNTALLDEIGQDLSRLSSPDEILDAVGARLGEFLNASGCIFADVDEARNEATIHHGWNAAGIPSLKQTFRLADYFGEEFARAGRRGETTVVRDTAHDERADAEAYAALQLGSFVTVPFRVRGQWRANITVTTREARDWRADEIDLVEEVAARIFPRVERARAEEALSVEKAHAESIIETLHEPLLVLTPDLRVRSANPAFFKHFEVRREESVGHLLYELGNGQWDIPELRTLLEDVLPDSHVFNDYEVAHDFEDIGHRVMLLNARRLDHVQLILLGIRDITDRKLAEEERRRALADEHAAREEAERALAVRDEFLAIVSHELRTPLAAMLLWARLLSMGRIPGREREAAETIERNAEAQRVLIEDLLDASRFMAGKIELEARSMPLWPLVAEVVDALRPVATEREVELVLDGHEDVHASIDPQRLAQALRAILDNGIRYSSPGGRVTVRILDVDGQARVAVADSGAGIAADVLPYVFDRFRRGDGRGGGLGLGLSIARDIVELHGGALVAESPGPGRGATFTISLPATPSSASRQRPSATPTDAGRQRLSGQRILVAENDRDTLDGLRLTLEAEGAEVVTAMSGHAAVGILRSDGRLDAVVSDLTMPDGDGFDVIRAIVAQADERPRRAVALTANVVEEQRRRALDAGFDTYLEKPADDDELVAALLS